MNGSLTLKWALGASLLVHGLLLTIRFVDPARFERLFEDSPLDVVLVNARTTEKPDQARVIAQAALAGGGRLEAGRAASPLPSAGRQQSGDAAEETQRQLAALKQQQLQLLTQLKQQLAALPVPDPQADGAAPGQSERETRRQQLSTLLAEIEKRVEEENARPQKRYISPATREESYALYYDQLRRQIEAKGTLSFPQQSGRKLYGALTMMLTINGQGQVLTAKVVTSSGQPALDRQALTIARGAGPFGAFTAAMRQQADQIVMVSRFEFTQNDTLRARLSPR